MAVVDVGRRTAHLLGHPGHQLHESAQRTHLSHLVQLGHEIVERERAAHHPTRRLGHHVLVHGPLGLLDQRQHVAHAQDPRGHSVGVKEIEVRELLARGRKDHRSTHHTARGQHRTASRVVVEFRHDHARELEGLVERLGGVHGVLTRDRVKNEERVVRRGGRADRLYLTHQRVINGETAGRVDNDHVTSEPRRLGDAALGDFDRSARVRKDVDANLLGEDAQLFDGRGAREVRGDEVRLATLLFEPECEFRRGRGLARALESREQDHGRRSRGVGDFERTRTQDLHQLFVHGLYDLLAGRKTLA